MVKTTRVNFDNMVKESNTITLLKLVRRCGKTWDLNASNSDALMVVHQIQNLPTVTDFQWKLSQMQYVNGNTIKTNNIIAMAFYHKGKYRMIHIITEDWLFAMVGRLKYTAYQIKKVRKILKKVLTNKKEWCIIVNVR